MGLTLLHLTLELAQWVQLSLSLRGCPELSRGSSIGSCGGVCVSMLVAWLADGWAGECNIESRKTGMRAGMRCRFADRGHRPDNCSICSEDWLINR